VVLVVAGSACPFAGVLELRLAERGADVQVAGIHLRRRGQREHRSGERGEECCCLHADISMGWIDAATIARRGWRDLSNRSEKGRDACETWRAGNSDMELDVAATATSSSEAPE